MRSALLLLLKEFIMLQLVIVGSTLVVDKRQVGRALCVLFFFCLNLNWVNSFIETDAATTTASTFFCEHFFIIFFFDKFHFCLWQASKASFVMRNLFVELWQYDGNKLCKDKVSSWEVAAIDFKIEYRSS